MLWQICEINFFLRRAINQNLNSHIFYWIFSPLDINFCESLNHQHEVLETWRLTCSAVLPCMCRGLPRRLCTVHQRLDSALCSSDWLLPHLSWKLTLEDEADRESSLSNLSIPDWPICYSCENFHLLEWVEWDFPLLQNILSAYASSWLMLMKHGSWCSHRHLLNTCCIHIWLAVCLGVMSALKLDHPGFKFHPLYLLAEWPWQLT